MEAVIRSESIGKLAAALAVAQTKFKVAEEDSNNPHFKAKFASYPSLYAACVPALNEHGIAVTHLPVSRDGKVGAVTMLLHNSGEFIGSEFLTATKDTGSQAAGSAVSYAKRYSLAGLCALRISDDVSDDDGEASEGRSTVTKKAAPRAHMAPTVMAEKAVEAKAAADAVRAAATPEKRVEKSREEQLADLAKRKQSVLDVLTKDYGDQDRIQLKGILGRDFPAGADIKFRSVAELEAVEKWLEENAKSWAEMLAFANTNGKK